METISNDLSVTSDERLKEAGWWKAQSMGEWLRSKTRSSSHVSAIVKAILQPTCGELILFTALRAVWSRTKSQSGLFIMDKVKQNALAKKLKALYVSGQPVLFANAWDAASTSLIVSNPATTAVATASYAIAATQGVDDNDLSLPQNFVGIRNCVAGLKKAGRQDDLPISADLQDGYEDIAKTIKLAIETGVVGANIEDVNNQTGQLRDVEESVSRIRTALKAAEAAGVPDFVINARTDALGYGGDIDIVIERGQRYLEAGATAVFVWGVGKWDIKQEEVQRMVKAFDGRLAVQPGSIGIERLKQLGVSRVSVGPALWRASMAVIEGEAEKLNLL